MRRRVGLSVAEIDLLQVEAAASKRQVVPGAGVLVAALAVVVSVGAFVVGQVDVIAGRQIQDNVPPWLACCRRSQPRGAPPVPGDLSGDSPDITGRHRTRSYGARGSTYTTAATAAHRGDDKVSAGSIRELPPTRQRRHTSACTAGAETWDTGVAGGGADGDPGLCAAC